MVSNLATKAERPGLRARVSEVKTGSVELETSHEAQTVHNDVKSPTIHSAMQEINGIIHGLD